MVHLLVIDDITAPPAQAQKGPPEPRMPDPLPIQHLPMDLPDGSKVTFAVWFNEDAARCRACPAGTCTFMPSPQGVGSCYHNVQGGLGLVSARLAAASGD